MICEALRVEISKFNEETKEWELFEDDDSEFQIIKDGDKISFKFNEVFPDDAGKYKVCKHFETFGFSRHLDFEPFDFRDIL